ncbi:hypothetical protein [Liquorilactobacillus nagelii]|uniref:hypothetical protein n=1 Tax=Liquorilactobacillus nagelii TaxID=82688 RepID=UPI001CCEF753|nr:hypothetical protein [Liquorilactobacillus nagelii]ULQ49041.1 hypothetical protein J6864_08735 [Liquorilactobacillus nagelii]
MSICQITLSKHQKIEYLEKEKQELRGTIYCDFVPTVNKNSIYKSIVLKEIKNDTAFYECEPYDDAYQCSNEDSFFKTCKKIERAFKKYYKRIFEKYNVSSISVEIYDEFSCKAGISVYSDGSVMTSEF